MFLAGDEFGNSQHGNNNAYCQDNMISWLDWSLPEKNKDLFNFFSYMINFRKQHAVIRKNTSACSLGFPPVSLHEADAWNGNYSWDSHVIGVMFAGKNETSGEDDIVFISINAYWENVTQHLPDLGTSMQWKAVVDTWQPSGLLPDPEKIINNTIQLKPRSVQVLVASQI